MQIKKCRYLTATWVGVNKDNKSFSIRCRPLKSGLFAVTTAAYSRCESAAKKDGVVGPIYYASVNRPFSVLSVADVGNHIECALHGSLFLSTSGLMVTFKPVGGAQ